MRCNNVKVKMSFSVPINKPDNNGVIYTEEALKNAYDNCEKVPIIMYAEDGKEVCVGVVEKAIYNDGMVEVDGVCWYGGTSETVELDDVKRVSQMQITSFGITR